MSGFGQICLRAGDEASALVAFQAALALNLNREPVRETLSAIERRLRRTLHGSSLRPGSVPAWDRGRLRGKKEGGPRPPSRRLADLQPVGCSPWRVP